MDAGHAELLSARLRQRGSLPRISVVTPVFRPSATFFAHTVASVQAQIYQDWEWCVCDDASGDTNLEALLRRLADQDSRVRLVTRTENGHISLASNDAAALATGDFLAFLDHDDLLSPDALGEVALYLADHPLVDVLYSDDDKVDADGRRFEPQFKPEWSPESLLSQMYFCHLFVVRRTLFERLGGFRLASKVLRIMTSLCGPPSTHAPLATFRSSCTPGVQPSVQRLQAATRSRPALTPASEP